MLLALAATLAPVAGTAPALAQSGYSAQPGAGLEGLLSAKVPPELRGFYAARGFRPLWIADGAVSPAGEILLDEMRDARFDGVNPRKLKTGSVASALRAAQSQRPKDLVKAEVALSRGYAMYVRAMRAAPRATMIYETPALAPVVPTPAAALATLAGAPSLPDFVHAMGWMHPLYGQVRSGLFDPDRSDIERYHIAKTLERIRALPANPGNRYVLVDAASARLWMYEDGRPVDSMKVVVGKPDNQTPMIAGLLRHAIVNPYWNVPGDLVQKNIANNVIDKGPAYLRGKGYQVLSDWSDSARPIDPTRIDWHAVAAGTAEGPRVRQLPGGTNFMGTVKYEFPNAQGIYLHDTPDKHLMNEVARQFSSGCVRLEDAPRLGRWLLEKPLPTRGRRADQRPEQRIALPQVVPVYITYLTAMPEGDRIAVRNDVYSLDVAPLGERSRQRLARAGQAW